MEQEKEYAETKGASSYPVHWGLIEQYAKDHNIRSVQTRSPALQRIQDHYMELTGYVLAPIVVEQPAVGCNCRL